MELFRVKWCRCPTSQNVPQVTFVEAVGTDAAREVVKDYIRRRLGIEWFRIDSVEPYTPPPASLGRVVEGPL